MGDNWKIIGTRLDKIKADKADNEHESISRFVDGFLRHFEEFSDIADTKSPAAINFMLDVAQFMEMKDHEKKIFMDVLKGKNSKLHSEFPSIIESHDGIRGYHSYINRTSLPVRKIFVQMDWVESVITSIYMAIYH